MESFTPAAASSSASWKKRNRRRRISCKQLECQKQWTQEGNKNSGNHEEEQLHLHMDAWGYSIKKTSSSSSRSPLVLVLLLPPLQRTHHHHHQQQQQQHPAKTNGIIIIIRAADEEERGGNLMTKLLPQLQTMLSNSPQQKLNCYSNRTTKNPKIIINPST